MSKSKVSKVSKPKAKAKRPSSSQILEAKLQEMQASLDALRSSPVSTVPSNTEPVQQTKPGYTFTQATKVQIQSKPLTGIHAHLAKARQAKADKDQMIKSLKAGGVIPQDAVLNAEGLKILTAVMQAASQAGSPILGMDRLMGTAFRLGELADRVAVCELALSKILPLTVSRPRQIVKTVIKNSSRVSEPQDLDTEIEHADVETETVEASPVNWLKRLVG